AACLDLLGREARLVGDEAHLPGNAPAGLAVEHDLDPAPDPEAGDVGHRDVDLHVLVLRVEHRDDRGPGLGELARPDELRLDGRRRIGRPDLELGVRHLELGEPRARELAPLPQHVRLPAGDGDRALLCFGAREQLAGAIEGARGLVAARARVVEELRRTGPALHQLLLALEGPPRHLGGGLGLAQLGLPRAHVALPGLREQRHLLLLPADVRLEDIELLALRVEAGPHVGVVQAGHDRPRRDGRALTEGDLEDAPRDLAPDDALLALDEAGVVRRPVIAADPPDRGREHGGDYGDHDRSPRRAAHYSASPTWRLRSASHTWRLILPPWRGRRAAARSGAGAPPVARTPRRVRSRAWRAGRRGAGSRRGSHRWSRGRRRTGRGGCGDSPPPARRRRVPPPPPRVAPRRSAASSGSRPRAPGARARARFGSG